MQRGRNLSLLVFTGALTLAVGMASAAFAQDLPPSKALPTGWKEVNLQGGSGNGSGNIAVSGPVTDPKSVWTMNVNGDDIQGTEDRGYFTYTSLPGDGGITARVLSQTGGNPGGWEKTGVMLRQDTTPGSPMATINQSTGQNGAETLFRTDPEAACLQAGPFGHGIPQWLRVQRKGQDYQLLLSDDGKQWQLIKDMTLNIAANKPVLAGLDGSTAAGGNLVPGVSTFDNVTVDNNVIVPPAVLGPVEAIPSAGAVLLTYGTAANAVGYNIYRRAATDTPDKAVKVNDMPTPYAWFIDDNGGKGLTNGTELAYQVKAVMKDSTGNLTEGAISPWILALPQMPILGGLYSYDIGTATPGSTTVDASNVLTITASGNDITGNGLNGSDGFRFVAMPVSGNYSITAKLLGKPAPSPKDTSTWLKAGVMIREGLEVGARMANVFVTNGNGLNMEVRRGYRLGSETVVDANSFTGTTPVADADVILPVWLRLTRSGDMIEGGYSRDGTTFTNIDPPNGPIPNLSTITYAGLDVTAQSEGNLATAKFDATSIKIQ